MVDPRRVIKTARTLIKRDGWVQDDSGAPDVGWCITGACDAAAGRLYEDYEPAIEMLYAKLPWAYKFLFMRPSEAETVKGRHYAACLAAFNDDTDHTVDDVLELIDKALEEG